MEFLLLAKVGMIIKGIVWGGYGVSGIIGAKTAVQYIADYKESVAREREMK